MLRHGITRDHSGPPIRRLAPCLAQRHPSRLNNSNSPVNPPDLQPLSFGQEGLWFLQQHAPASSFYNMTRTFEIEGVLQEKALAQSLNAVIQRHETLRTTFVASAGNVSSRVASELSVAIEVIDLTGLAGSVQQAAGRERLEAEAQRPFDLAQGPLFRCLLLRLGPEQHLLMFVFHHLIMDGSSLGIFYGELALFYGGLLNGQTPRLPELSMQYSDFAAWQRQRVQDGSWKTQMEYWRRKLSALPAVELPTDHVRPAVRTCRGALESLSLPTVLVDSLERLCGEEEVTLFTALLAAIKVLFHRHTGLADITLGIPVAQRRRSELKPLLGFLVNNLILRTDLSGNPTFREVLQRVRKTTSEAYAHQDIPMEVLVAELHPQRDLSRTPFFQCYVNQSPVKERELLLPGVRAQFVPLSSASANFDLEIYVTQLPDALQLGFLYNPDLYEAATIRWLVQHCHQLLGWMTSGPDRRLADVPLPAPLVLGRIPAVKKPGTSSIPFTHLQPEAMERTVSQRFESAVHHFAERLAIHTDEHRWTYAALDQAAHRVASAVVSRVSEKPQRIGLLFESGAPAIAAIIGVLKTSHAYVPLDASYPPERLKYMLEDSEAALLLCNDDTLGRAQKLAQIGCKLINVDDLERDPPPSLPLTVPAPDSLAYLIYTSGSTGRPKGVMQNHRNVLHFHRVYTNSLHLGPDDRLSLFASISFDAAVMDIFGALLNGASMHPWNLRARGLPGLPEWLNDRHVTILHSTPTLYRRFVAEQEVATAFPFVRAVVLGGEEVLSGDIESYKRHFLDHCLFVNGFGPTESTMALQYFADKNSPVCRSSVPMGYAVEDTKVVLINPDGIESLHGEICVKSAHVALGYWRQPELSATRFVSLTDPPCEVMYATGDWGRRLFDGSIVFAGRKDHQVKVRGFRVELAEIEEVLLSHPAVSETVVLAREDAPGDKRLVAYLVAQPANEPPIPELRKFLRGKLPDYMIPAGFVFVKALPLTSSGKTDRQALPDWTPAERRQARQATVPRTPLELQLTQIWERVLAVPSVSLHDNFFELGGDSLLAMNLLSEIDRALDLDVPLVTLLQNPTVEELAKTLEQQNPGRRVPAIVSLRNGSSEVPLFFINPGALEFHLASLLDGARAIFGTVVPLSAEVLEAAFANQTSAFPELKDLAARHVRLIIERQPASSYFLAGFSFEGLVAFEVAHQLQRAGRRVEAVFLLDSLRREWKGWWWFKFWVRKHIRNTFEHGLAYVGKKTIERLQYEKRKRAWGLKGSPSPPPGMQNTSAKLDDLSPAALWGLQFKIQWNAWQAYRPRRLKSRGILFRAQDTVKHLEIMDRSLGWSGLFSGELEIVDVPGEHHSFLQEPHIQTLAQRFDAILRQTRR
jgi:amino acid adenylation domain-containing protein